MNHAHPAGDRAPGISARLTVALAAFGAIAPVAIDMFLPGVPAMARDLGVDAARGGTSISVFFVGMAVGQLFAGPLSDRIGRRPMILGGLACFILGGLAAAFSQTFALLLAARIVQALGACAVTTCSRAAVRDMLDAREAARLFSLLALIGGMIPLVAPMIGNLMLTVWDWRAMFLAMAAAGLLMVLLVLGDLPESRSEETMLQARAEHPFLAYLGLLGHPAMRWTLLAAACNSGAMFSYLANSPAVLMEGYGMASLPFTLAITANSFALVLFSQLNRIWLKTRQPHDVLRHAALAMAALGLVFAALAAPLAGTLAILLPALFALMAIAALVQVNAMTCALSIDARRGGSAAALFGAVTFAAGALLSWIAGLLFRPDGSGLALMLACVLLVGAGSLRMMLRSIHRTGPA